MSPADPVRAICDDLEAEHEALDALVADLEASRWDIPTPAEGWAVRDQIAHLASYDVAARLAVTDAVAWAQEVGLAREERERRQLESARRRSPRELLAWWREAGARCSRSSVRSIAARGFPGTGRR